MIKKIKKNWLPLIFSLIFGLIWSQIMYRSSFGDEHENMVAGWLINQGYVPYKDFFFHHAPLPFFVSAILQIFRGPGYQIYRIFVLGFHLLTFWIGHKFSAKKIRPVLFFVYLLIAISSPFLSTFHLLADSLVASSLVVLAFLLYSGYQYKQPSFTAFFKVLAVLGIVTVFSSVVYGLALLLIFSLSLIVYWPQISKNFKTKKQQYLKLGTSAALVALIFPLYFIINGAFEPFYWSTVKYNQDYYFTDHLAEDQLELKYGFIFRIGRQFLKHLLKHIPVAFRSLKILIQTIFNLIQRLIINNLHGSVAAILDASWGIFWSHFGQIETSVAFVFVLSLSYWLIKKWKVGLVYLMLALAFRARSNEIFHQAPFYFLVFASLGVIVVESFQKVIKKRSRPVFLLSLTLLTQLLFAFGSNFKQQLNWNVPIIEPSIIRISQEIEQNTQPGDKILIIGGLPTYYMLSKRLPATKYFYYHPWFKPAARIRNNILETVENKKAAFIFYQDLSEDRRYDQLMEQAVEQNYQKVETSIKDFYGYVPQNN